MAKWLIFALFFCISCGGNVFKFREVSHPIDTNLIHINIYGAPVLWRKEKIPLNIHISEDLSEHQRETVVSAIKYWNSELDFKLFKIDPKKNSDITLGLKIIGKSKNDLRYLGVCSKTFDYVSETQMYINKAEIYLGYDLWTKEVYKTTLHELGHAIGLGHSDSLESIMFPQPMASTSFLTDGQKRALWLFYGTN